jgi:hypothetical protein
MANEKKTTVKKAMTEEQKAAAAERMRKAREAKKAAEAEKAEKQSTELPDISPIEKEAELIASTPLYDEATVQRMIADATTQAVTQAIAQQQAQAVPQIVRISQEQEKVLFLWQAEVAPDNVELFGENGMYGRITGKTGTFYVPKSELSRVLTERVRYYIDHRWLIVLSGLNDEEREALNANYKDGELMDEKEFLHMLDLGNGLIDVYKRLCDDHKKMIAMRVLEAYQTGDKRITRTLVTDLNEISRENARKKYGADSELSRGDFVRVIEVMNRRDEGK